MPSRFEPCGLTQQQALRYGTVPIVHACGGLKDTVKAFNPWKQSGNGWAFSPLKPEAFQQALMWAMHTYRHHPTDFRNLQIRGMSEERSWKVAAYKYEKVFQNILRSKQR